MLLLLCKSFSNPNRRLIVIYKKERKQKQQMPIKVEFAIKVIFIIIVYISLINKLVKKWINYKNEKKTMLFFEKLGNDFFMMRHMGHFFFSFYCKSFIVKILCICF